MYAIKQLNVRFAKSHQLENNRDILKSQQNAVDIQAYVSLTEPKYFDKAQ